VLLITCSLVLTLVAGELLDRLAPPGRPLLSGGPAALGWRAALIAAAWLLAMGLSARPLLAAVATAVGIGIVVAISALKQRYLREPLVFSDFALLENVLRHPQMFYVPRRRQGLVIAGVAALLAAIAAWMTIEPRAIGFAAQGLSLLAAAGLAAMLAQPRSLAAAARLVHGPEPARDLGRLGLLVSLFTYAAAWRLEPEPEANVASSPTPLPSRSPDQAIIVVQAESFVDLRRLGRSELRLPAFDRLRQRALAAGLIAVACQGAYTLRPESAVIGGLGFSEQGFDRFHPYLRPHRWAATALPRSLAAAGWDTLFVHPYDPAFFRRARAMPALGFARIADERAVAGAARVGPYVSDEAVARLVIDEIEASRGPLFVYAVTLEAHDPYGPGRLPDEDDPVRQYIRHIENADRMLAQIADALDRRAGRALLVLFGDHVPVLPEFADPFPDTRTDYVAVELGRAARRTRIAHAVTRPEHLHALICARLEDPAAARPDGTAAQIAPCS
jgi:hypothetical protein